MEASAAAAASKKPRHNVFLSHSGAQKDFVEQLCEDLERASLTPFFDKRPDSLPKGEEFAPRIILATQECEVAVVVISEQYFTRSKWPMSELEMLVNARDTCTVILPLFYRLSCKEFKNPRRREQWFQVWAEWSQSDSRICVQGWKDALRELDGRTGMEYVKAVGEVAYRKDIVRTVCHMATPSDLGSAATASGKDECGLQQPRLSQFVTSRLHHRVFACLQSILLFLLWQVVFFLTLLLLLLVIDHNSVDPNAPLLCPCPPSYDDPILLQLFVNQTLGYPTSALTSGVELNNRQRYLCRYNSALQQDMIKVSKQNCNSSGVGARRGLSLLDPRLRGPF